MHSLYWVLVQFILMFYVRFLFASSVMTGAKVWTTTVDYLTVLWRQQIVKRLKAFHVSMRSDWFQVGNLTLMVGMSKGDIRNLEEGTLVINVFILDTLLLLLSQISSCFSSDSFIEFVCFSTSPYEYLYK